jgi:hypothetical protein
VGRARTNQGWLTYGLAVGSADLIGLVEGGRFVSLEVKTPSGVQSPEQIAWGRMVERLGGIHAVVRSIDDARSALGLW